MRIVHVHDRYIAGMGYQENFLPREQKELGHEVSIITSDRISHYQELISHLGGQFENRIMGPGVEYDDGIEIHRLPCVLEMKKGALMYLAQLKRRLLQLSPDVVQLHGALTLTTLRVMQMSRYRDYSLFVDDHSHSSNLNIDSTSKKFYVNMARFFHRFYGDCVKCYLPVNHASKDILDSLLGVNEEKIELLPLGVDDRHFMKSEALRLEGRKKIGIEDDEILIITSGKFHEDKDIDYLIRAFECVIREFDCVKLLILGSGKGEYMDYLHTLVNDLDIQDRVLFEEFIAHGILPAYYNAADIGVWPGNPTITVIEALGCGLPIVVPEEDNAYEILFENNAAFGFRRKDIESLSRQICNLVSNSGIRDRVILNSYRLVENQLSWRSIAKRSIEIYEDYL